MRLVYTHRLKSDMVLARPLVSEEGTLLLAEGVPLGESLIHRLVEVGVPFVYVRDDRFPTDRVQPLVSPQSLRRVTADLRGFWCRPPRTTPPPPSPSPWRSWVPRWRS